MRKQIMVLFLALLSMPAGLMGQQAVSISLKQAVEAALEPGGNTRIQLATEMVRQAEARAAQERGNLLPDISASVGQQTRTINLTTFGLQMEGQPGTVGPFNTFDARGTVTQKLFDLSSLRRYKAANVGTEAARHENESTKDDTAALVARAYLAAVRAQAVVETARANVELSEALLRLAGSQKAAGTGTGIEVTRAQVQLANDRQSRLAAQTEYTKTRLGLLRAMGLDLDVPVDLTDRLSYSPAEDIAIKQAIGTAQESLAALKAQQKREEGAALRHSAIGLERLPSLVGFADYGSIGLRAKDATPTRTVGASLRIPIFDGGKREARRAEALAELKQERIRTADLVQETGLRIRVALDAIHSAQAQVEAAEEGLALSTNELEQAQRRYQAGVAYSIEVTDAQTRLQRARDNRISAIFAHALARVDLAAAMGSIQELVNNWR
jgi:outer membrane protein